MKRRGKGGLFDSLPANVEFDPPSELNADKEIGVNDHDYAESLNMFADASDSESFRFVGGRIVRDLDAACPSPDIPLLTIERRGKWLTFPAIFPAAPYSALTHGAVPKQFGKWDPREIRIDSTRPFRVWRE